MRKETYKENKLVEIEEIKRVHNDARYLHSIVPGGEVPLQVIEDRPATPQELEILISEEAEQEKMRNIEQLKVLGTQPSLTTAEMREAIRLLIKILI